MKKQLFTLLTLLVMCVTGAWAAHGIEVSGTTVTETWDFGEISFASNVDEAPYTSPSDYSGLSCVMTYDKGKDYITSGGFHPNGNTANGNRYIAYTPSYSGTITVYAKANGNSNSRYALIATSQSAISADPSVGTNGCIAVSKDLNGNDTDKDHFSVSLTSKTTYYIEVRQGVTITKIVYEYTLPAPTSPTVSEEGNITGGSKITVNSTNASTIYYYWSDNSTAPATGDAVYTSASGASVEVTAPNVTGTRYLHTYGYNATGTTNVATFTYSLTKTQLSSGLEYTTISIEKNIGDDNFTNVLSNPNSLNVTYSITSNGTGSSINSSTGEVTLGGQSGTETITARSEASEDYLAGEATYTLTLNEAYTVTYAIGEGTGVAPAAVSDINKGTAITLPKNFTMYKEGYTMTGWSDGTTTYATGASYTVNGNVTLTAQYTANTVSLEDRTQAVSFTFDFRRENGAPTVQWGENSGAHVWVTQANVAGKTIDVKADINVTASGKVANANWTDWVQINNTTEITIPSENGATVKIRAYDEKNATTVNGNAKDSYASNVYTYNVASDDATAQVVIDKGTGAAYYKYIEVTLPSKSEILPATAANTQFVLTKNNINSYDFVSVSHDKWNEGKTYGDYSGDFYNMSSNRSLTMKVTGANSFEVYVQNTNSGRSYTVKIGNNNEVTVNHGGSGMESSGVFTIDNPNATTTIVITGASGSGSVYPVYAMFNPAVSATTTAAGKGWATLYTDKALNFAGAAPNTLKAYTATLENNVVTLTEVQNVPAGTGVVLKSSVTNANTTYSIPVIASSETAKGSMLGSTTEAKAATEQAPIFILKLNSTGNAQFMRATSGSLGAGKAYLPVGTQAKALTVVFTNETTGIANVNAVETAQPVKRIVNGQLIIEKNGKRYNAAGTEL